MATQRTKSSITAAKSKTSKPKELAVEALFKKIKSATAEKPSASILSTIIDAGLSSPLIVYASQRLRTKRLISWLSENSAPGNHEIKSYHGNELNSGSAVDSLAAEISIPSLFSPSSTIVIFDSEKVKSVHAHKLADAILKKPQSSLVIICADAPNQKAALLNATLSEATVVKIPELKGAQLKQWITKEAKRIVPNGSIDALAVNLLADRFGDDVTAISQELEKLALLVEVGSPITAPLVEALCLRSPEQTSFDLIDNLARKNSALAVITAARLQDQGIHPLQISSFLSKSLRTILANKDYNSAAKLNSEFSNPWFARKLENASRQLSKEDLLHAIQSLAELDFQLKSSGFKPELALSVAVQKMASRAF
jgi:DNA polymerase-3 subunit delta